MEELEWEHTFNFKQKLLLNEFREHMIRFQYQLKLGNKEKEKTIIYGHNVILCEGSTYYPYECFYHRFTRFSTKKCKCIECLRERNHILRYRAVTSNINVFSHLPFRRKKLRPNPFFYEEINDAYPELGIDEEKSFIPFNSP